MTNTKCYWKIIYGEFLNQSLFSIIFIYIRKSLNVMECNAFCRWNTQLGYNIFWWLYLQIKKGIHKIKMTNLSSGLNIFRVGITSFLLLQNFPLEGSEKNLNHFYFIKFLSPRTHLTFLISGILWAYKPHLSRNSS